MTNLATPPQLPPLLREPPWTSGRRAPDPPRLVLAPLVGVVGFNWTNEERERAQRAYDMPVFVGQLSGEPRQTLGKLGAFDTLDKAETFHPDKPIRFARADPIAISETLRDLHRLVPSSLRTP